MFNLFTSFLSFPSFEGKGICIIGIADKEVFKILYSRYKKLFNYFVLKNYFCKARTRRKNLEIFFT